MSCIAHRYLKDRQGQKRSPLLYLYQLYQLKGTLTSDIKDCFSASNARKVNNPFVLNDLQLWRIHFLSRSACPDVYYLSVNIAIITEHYHGMLYTSPIQFYSYSACICHKNCMQCISRNRYVSLLSSKSLYW